MHKRGTWQYLVAKVKIRSGYLVTPIRSVGSIMDAVDLSQRQRRVEFENAEASAWIVLRDSWHDSDSNGAIYCALAHQSYRPRAVSAPTWDLRVTDGAPGFWQSHSGGEVVTGYHSRRDDDSVEPLVLVREFHGTRPSSIELDQEFRLFHNLAFDAGAGGYFKPADDGTEILAVKIEGTKVSVRSPLVKQYAAARQLDLLLFIDSVVFGEESDPLPEREEVGDQLSRIGLYPSNDQGGSLGQRFSRLLATRVITPSPIETCGKWPYENKDNHYPEYYIGEDGHGSPISFTCDPEKLANYFGANPDAPQYLTPVHFRRDVLQKYYERPELYSVEDGYLRCAGLWGIRIDNDHVDRVVVFLGDLGRDLPARERDYWRGHQILPDGDMSETNVRRSFLAQFADAKSVDLIVRSLYWKANTAFTKGMGWPLFKEPHGSDQYLLQRLRLPLNDSDTEFETAIRVMTQLFIDSLNEADIQRALGSKVPNEKGIAKLARYLADAGYPEAARDSALLRRLQTIRSQLTAHRKSSDYEIVLYKNFGNLRGWEAIASILQEARVFLTDVSEWASQKR